MIESPRRLCRQDTPQAAPVKGSLSGCPLADAGKACTLDSVTVLGHKLDDGG